MILDILLMIGFGVCLATQWLMINRLEEAERQIRQQWRRLDNDE